MDSPPIFVIRPGDPDAGCASFQALNPAIASYQTFAPPADLDAETLGDTSLYGPSALARARAHIGLWRRCAESGTPLTVCDDGVALRADFPAVAARLLQDLTGYDCVLWGWRSDAVVTLRLASGAAEVLAGQAERDPLSLEAFQVGDAMPVLRPLSMALGVGCYTLSPEGARRLLSRALPFTAFSMQLPLTPQPRANSDLDAVVSRQLPDLAAFVSMPPLARDASSFAGRTSPGSPAAKSREAALRDADLLQRQGRPAEALSVLQAAAQTPPDNAVVLGKLGAALAAEGRLAAASAALERALAVDDRDEMTSYNLATLRLRQQRHAEALVLLERALQARPGFELAQSNLGVALLGLGRHAEAEGAFRRALALDGGSDEARRGLAAALVIRSGAHELSGEFEQAHGAAFEATKLHPELAGAFNNLGVAHLRLGRPAAAEDAFRSALALIPDYADAHYGLAFALLQQERFHEAWPEYDWRLKTAEYRSWASGFAKPRWDGTPSPGSSLLLVAEQGLGDTIMTSRFAALARARVGRIVLRVPRTLAGLLKRLPGVDDVVAEDEPVAAPDLWSPLMSLPGLLGVGPGFSPERLPKLTADPDKVRSWAQVLPKDGLRVGVAWQGNRAARVEPGRSIPLEAFKSLVGAGVRLVSLQKGDGSEQLAHWEGAGRPLDLGDAYRAGDMADTAAVISNLDLVISCDTSVAHLAGALGQPTWIAVGSNPDWRWLKGREDAIWYESVRVHRLGPGERWDALFGRIRTELAKCQVPDTETHA